MFDEKTKCYDIASSVRPLIKDIIRSIIEKKDAEHNRVLDEIVESVRDKRVPISGAVTETNIAVLDAYNRALDSVLEIISTIRNK